MPYILQCKVRFTIFNLYLSAATPHIKQCSQNGRVLHSQTNVNNCLKGCSSITLSVPDKFFFSCYKRSGLPITQAAPSEQGQRPCGEEAAQRSHASAPYPERGSPLSERPQAARAQLRFPARPGRARAPIAAVASRSQGPASAGEKGATATAAPPPGSEEWKEERRRHRGRPHAVRRSPGCSPCGRQAAGPLAKALRDPTARQRVGRGRPAPSRPGWAGPGAWAYSFSSALRPPTVSGDRRASPAPRTHQVAAGARHGPRPAGRRGPRSSRPLRAQRTAAQPEPMGLSHPLSVTSPTTMPPPLWAELPSNPQIHWSCYLPLTRKPARSASHQPQRTVSVSMRSCCGVAAGFTSCRGEGGRVRALSSFRLALTSGFSPCGRDAVGAAVMTSGGRVVPTPLHVVTARGAACSPGSSWCPIP